MHVKTFSDWALPVTIPDTTGGTPVIDPGMLRKGGWIAIRLSPSTLQAPPQ
jgi:hypothetical protein